jgi:hypothetical protein
MRTTWLLGVGVVTVGLAVVSACTGDDPVIAPGVDSGASDGAAQPDGGDPGADGSADGSAADGSADAGACAMRPFQAPLSVGLPADFAYGPRFYTLDGGTRMQYVATPGAADAGHDLHEAIPSGGMAFVFDSPVPNVNTPADEWAPAPSGDGAFMVFARGPIGSRSLYLSNRVAGTFNGGTLIPVLQPDTNNEDTDGYLLADGSAYYFASNRAGGGGLGLYRSAHQADGFDPASSVLPSGPGTRSLPVVDSAETTMLYAESPTRDLSMGDIVETRLDAAHQATGTPMAHPELSTAVAPDSPAWLSPDGCTLYFQRGFSAGSQVFVARR